MNKIMSLLMLAIVVSYGCQSQRNLSSPMEAKNTSTELTCKMVPSELLQRKQTVLASLKEKVTSRKELPNGYAFRFPGNDNMIDELTEFIKTERECCDFFIFNLSVSGDKSEAWLTMTGVEGAKAFITEELGL